MFTGRSRLGQILALCVSAGTFACGAAPAAKAPAPAPLVAAAPRPEPVLATTPAPAPTAEVTTSLDFGVALASLRPSGTEKMLQVLAESPTDAEAYARAALAYAPTDVAGMALLWGLTYQAMGGGASDAAVAAALAKVLTERIVAKPDDHDHVTFNVRLAPGQMPTRQEVDGALHGPIAHVFEGLFSPAVTGFRPPWTIEQFYDVLSTWAGLVATQGTPLDALVPVDGWLVVVAKAGYLEAFCYQLLGPAFPAELKAYKAGNPKALKAYREFLKANSLHPRHAPMPDELVRLEVAK
jgi:hypothetical protein